MLTRNDSGDEVNRRIATALSQWNEAWPISLESDFGESGHAERLRRLMETGGRAGTIRPVRRDGVAAFVYLCFSDRGRPFAQGLGDTPERAILDAFIQCSGIPAGLSR
jgi:hypothetical protein